ncbi:nucleoside triphosphate pyrophosphohydrolase [Iodidimonas muriae]|uniref:Nucleoside triphosphate pyrophosphohydrolase n=1 Tax=Iodidimonas muriae TaxID=261467 RepID=A0ABQ2LEX1_9PROT|nr:nucleoside triphosphate pyrophosphohydrolase [Iodidimonas muriae]GER07117.1 nucleoside triphosphate pyrophosphohydrolase [Kordiimonadales bacterium JCM 17843]GGO12931.1 nucleoside triphosphate pyrophosphohydrolase [Iodidimonas muriae]
MSQTCRPAAPPLQQAPDTIERLLEIMSRLRAPEGGCPWDIAQNFETVAPYTIEEAYEVADAIARKDMDDLCDELGDLLFQVVFHAQMGKERGAFDFSKVVAAICDKMERRHPHVFGDATVADADAQVRAWEEQKAKERAARAQSEGRTPSALEGVARGLPALMRAVKLQKRAARVGFDWDNPKDVIAKIREELDEVEEVLEKKEAPERRLEEMGDLLFSCANLARFIKSDPEDALVAANAKFERRFKYIEDSLAAKGRNIIGAGLAEMEALWVQAKSTGL